MPDVFDSFNYSEENVIIHWDESMGFDYIPNYKRGVRKSDRIIPV
jgi:hypothetical protein